MLKEFEQKFLTEDIWFHIDEVLPGSDRVLSDGTVVKKGDKMGWIEIEPEVVEGERAVEYYKRLKVSISNALYGLAQLVQNETSLSSIQVFGGYSHLARHATKYGFDVFPIEDIEERTNRTEFAHNTTELVVEANSFLVGLAPMRPIALEALISRRTLLMRYAS